MSYQESFNSDCKTILDKNKVLLESKIGVLDQTKELDLDSLYLFNEAFELHQSDLAIKLIEYLNLYPNLNLQKDLEPIAKFYIVAFLKLVNIPNIE